MPKLLGANFKPHGIRKEATVGKPDNLHPFNNWSEVATWNSLCTVALTAQQIGIYETFTPEMASSMELRQSPEGYPEYWLTLRKDVFWKPLNPNFFPSEVTLAPIFLQTHQVTARDFKFYYDALMNPHVESSQAVAMRLYYDDIEEMRVIDDFTLVVSWKTKKFMDAEGQLIQKMKYMAKFLTGSLRPLPCFVFQRFADGTKIIDEGKDTDVYRTNPVWAQNFSHHWAQNYIVSCGPWQFDGMSDTEIRFKRNSDYFQPEAALAEAYEVKFRDSPDAIWDRVQNRLVRPF